MAQSLAGALLLVVEPRVDGRILPRTLLVQTELQAMIWDLCSTSFVWNCAAISAFYSEMKAAEKRVAVLPPAPLLNIKSWVRGRGRTQYDYSLDSPLCA